ncbi:MAG: hypothetical protein KF889_04900 [Alphaproteobacteria bacterium]|nr:hypothetical protein [Alphaproteobacteria bacterium]MCW5742207.1 hypothetical protein [Alphaproteobacteria bacterium]
MSITRPEPASDEDYAATFNTPHGRRVLNDLARSAILPALDLTHPDPHLAVAIAARLNEVLRIRNRVEFAIKGTRTNQINRG